MGSRALQKPVRMARHLSKPALLEAKPQQREARCKIAMIGFGTVGRSVAKVLCERAGRVLLTHVCSRSVNRERAPWLPPEVRWP